MVPSRFGYMSTAVSFMIAFAAVGPMLLVVLRKTKEAARFKGTEGLLHEHLSSDNGGFGRQRRLQRIRIQLWTASDNRRVDIHRYVQNANMLARKIILTLLLVGTRATPHGSNYFSGVDQKQGRLEPL